MKIMKPKPFTFEAGPRAVLLLHGFTGHSADVRMLGRYLEKKGYTTHAPIYRGHGLPPESLLDVTPEEWWEDVVEAYEHLQSLGYEDIAIAGLSMGGVLGLKLASERKTMGVLTMCTPMFFDNETQLTQGFRQFAKQYKQLEQKEPDEIEDEVKELMAASGPIFEHIGRFVKEVNGLVDLVYTPGLVIQSVKDGMINPKSATFIYEHLESDDKRISWYENSEHVITMGQEKDKLHEDIYTFLEGLEWEE